MIIKVSTISLIFCYINSVIFSDNKCLWRSGDPCSSQCLSRNIIWSWAGGGGWGDDKISGFMTLLP